MKLHFVLSEHEEGDRLLSLKDGRAVKIAASGMLAVPCEGVRCSICQQRIDTTDTGLEVFTFDSRAVPEEFKTVTIVPKRDGTTVRVLYVKAELEGE